jgi:hypothetical protein
MGFWNSQRTSSKRELIIPVPDRKKLYFITCFKKICKSRINYLFRLLERIHKDYFSGHFYVNHSLGFKDPIIGVHTNTIEGSWGAIKAKIPKAYRTKTRMWPYLIRYKNV